MDAISLLHSRNSAPKLCAPAPSGEVLNDLFRAALRAPDHARLRPWRFLTIAGDARNKLGAIFAEAGNQRNLDQQQPPLSQQERDKLAAKTLRAPLIVVVIATIREHPKVPEIEQLLSAGCAAHAILLAAHAHGFAGIWRTGDNAFDPYVQRQLGLSTNEQLVGFVYLGSLEGAYKPLKQLAINDFFQSWEASDVSFGGGDE